MPAISAANVTSILARHSASPSVRLPGEHVPVRVHVDALPTKTDAFKRQAHALVMARFAGQFDLAARAKYAVPR